MHKIKRNLAIVVFSLLVGSPLSSYARPASDLLKEKDTRFVYSYLAGLADMLSFTEFANDNTDRGGCIYDWFHAPDSDAIEKIYYYMDRHPDRFAEAIMIVLTNSACPVKE